MLILIFISILPFYRRLLSKKAGPTLTLASLSLRLDNGLGLRAVFSPSGEFWQGRSRMKFDRLEVDGRLWPPLAECDARLTGFSMEAASLRPSGALESMFELERLTGAMCPTLRISSGDLRIGDTPELRLELTDVRGVLADSTLAIRIDRMDGQPTALRLNAKKSGAVTTSGEWNLSGLDVTALLSRIGMSWNSKTDVGLLEFETAGDEREESGVLRISSWVLLGKNRPRPFRLSVPRLSAQFIASDSEIVFQSITVDQPRYDLIGANPDIFKNILTTAPVMRLRPKKVAEPKVPVSARHQASVSALPDTFVVRVLGLTIDSGSALMLDRPAHTQFALKISDLAVRLSGPASWLGRDPNTDIRFLANDKKEMRWKAITDFSTWPPQFRLVDVR